MMTKGQIAAAMDRIDTRDLIDDYVRGELLRTYLSVREEHPEMTRRQQMREAKRQCIDLLFWGLKA
jgi:hypothetical protein